MIIPYNDLRRIHDPLQERFLASLTDCLSTNDFIGGEQIEAFEENLQKQFGLKYVRSCANGTDALYGAVKALDLKPNDEVIVPAMTWISSAEIVNLAGAKIVFCDVSPDTFLMEAKQIKRIITKKTRAIILVHLYGNMPEMTKILKLADQYELQIIEDCAQAHLSSFGGITAGNFGKFGTFSFFPGKNLGALGDSGAVSMQCLEDYTSLKYFFNHGQAKKNDHQIIGMNSRLDALQARFLNIKLEFIHNWTQQRREIANQYNIAFKNLSFIRLPKIHEAVDHSYHIYSVLVDDRVKFTNYLRYNGISFNINYPVPLHKTKAYHIHNTLCFPNSEDIAAKQVSLPLFPNMTEAEIEHVINIVINYE